MTCQSIWLLSVALLAVASGLPIEGDGEDLDTKIVGGNLTAITAYPYIASSQVEMSPGVLEQVCGASILNDRWLLTAAHCHGNPRHVGKDFYVRAGVGCNMCTGIINEQRIKVKKVHIHPSYTPINRYDLALLELESPLTFTRFVQPIDLPPKTYMPTGRGDIMGWGAMGNPPQLHGTQFLKAANVGIVPLDQCKQYITSGVTDSHVCIGDPEKHITGCYGDSGGPFVQVVDGKKVVVAVTSFGGDKPCGEAPGAYVRVGPFVDSFINHVIGRNPL